jgi:hypothetical protein
MRLGANLVRVRPNHDQSVAAVALPSLGHPLSAHSDAHLTLVYAGQRGVDNPNITGLRSTVQYLARVGAPFVAEIVGTEMFGDNHDEPVLLLEHPEFKAMRRFLEDHNASQWPFRPHVAVPTFDGLHRMPAQVAFDRLGLWLGDDREHYWLGTGTPTGV